MFNRGTFETFNRTLKRCEISVIGYFETLFCLKAQQSWHFKAQKFVFDLRLFVLEF